MTSTIKTIARSVARGSAFSVFRNKLYAKSIPFQSPPLLILSYPRSGSTWVGKVLSASKEVAYLREPITQQYLFKYGGRFALVDLNDNPRAGKIYRHVADEAFYGIPPRGSQIVNDLRDYVYPYRKSKHIMIKEVNPKAAGFYCERYNPKILLLLRHPAAIALSFYHLGWLESPDAQLETDNPTASSWEKFGYAYGMVMHDAVETLRAHGNHEIVIYRNLAQEPYSGFKGLFSSMGLELPENYDAVINRYCYSSKQTENRGEIERTSRNMVFKWRNELSEEQVRDLQTGYLKSKLEYFRDARDWTPSDDGAHS